MIVSWDTVYADHFTLLIPFFLLWCHAKTGWWFRHATLKDLVPWFKPEAPFRDWATTSPAAQLREEDQVRHNPQTQQAQRELRACILVGLLDQGYQ
jgi:hypothetical protein